MDGVREAMPDRTTKHVRRGNTVADCVNVFFFILPQRNDSIDSQLLKLHRIRNSELIQYLVFYGFLADELGLANFNGAPK